MRIADVLLGRAPQLEVSHQGGGQGAGASSTEVVATRGTLRAPFVSIGDNHALELLRYTTPDPAPDVTERSVLGLPGMYRALQVVGGTIAGLPLRHMTERGGTRRELPATWVTNPGAVMGRTAFGWKYLTLVHAILWNETIQLIIRGGAGQVVGLEPLHPGAVSVGVDPATGARAYKVRLAGGGERELADDEVLHVVWLTADGVRGTSMLSAARQSLGTSLSAERTAGRVMANGLAKRTLVTPRDSEQLDDSEGQAIADRLADEAGPDNAGKPLWVNKMVQLDPYSMSAEDAQFIEQRQFQIEDVARLTGVPPHLLMQTEKQTSWGTGVHEQNRGLARYTLMPWTTGLQESLTLLTSAGQWAEFDYAQLLQATPEVEVRLLIEQVQAGLLTVDEARAIRNLPPLTEDTGARDDDSADGGTVPE